MSDSDFDLVRDAFGRLVLNVGGASHVGIVPVRAFPIADPDNGIALMSPDGHELVWIAHLADLPSAQRTLVEEELAGREFVPEIRRIAKVSSFATPSEWTVETDRGATRLILKGEEDIRRLSRNMLLIADSNGIQFLVRDLTQLDRASRRLLDRFL